MEEQKNNAAKYAFFYFLSLIALVFVAVASGTIIFQIINKQVVDIINQYSGTYQDSAIRFGISALIIAAPIFYICTRQIYKNLYSGALSKESGVRKWLTYLILLVAVVVMISWLIATLNNFLSGEITTKFILKSLTALLISGFIFSFYLYDIRREEVVNKKDKVVRSYFYISLVLILVILASAFMIVDSPTNVRNQKIDEAIISDFQQLNSAIYNYYNYYDKLPANLAELSQEYNYIDQDYLDNPSTNKAYVYNAIGDDEYELCTDFITSSKDDKDVYYDKSWLHDAGYQCIKQKINNKDLVPVPDVRI